MLVFLLANYDQSSSNLDAVGSHLADVHSGVSMSYDDDDDDDAERKFRYQTDR